MMRERPHICMCQRCDGGCCMLYFVVFIHFWLGSRWAPEKGKNGNKPLFCRAFFARWHNMTCSFAFVNAVWWRCLESACARAIFCCSNFPLNYCSVKFSLLPFYFLFKYIYFYTLLLFFFLDWVVRRLFVQRHSRTPPRRRWRARTTRERT